MNELQIPTAAVLDGRSLELARIWAADGKQHVCLRTGIWDDPGAWGIMLADLARHVANSYQQSGKTDHASALKRIVEAFHVELDSPSGNLLQSQ